APRDGEETLLAERRTTMMQGEKIAADLREAQEAVGGDHSPLPALSAAVRRLERRAANSPALVEPAVKAIDIAINALEEADQHLSATLVAADLDPAELERIEERLFALRAASRKYSTPVDGLATLAAKFVSDVALIDAGADRLKKLEAGAAEADRHYRGSAPTLVFDEIDTGVGGAVADAIGARLSRLAGQVQVMAVTHAPQVAARANQHLLISKDALDKGKRVATRVNALAADHRREEIARMLAGAEITAEARAAAERLLRAATA